MELINNKYLKIISLLLLLSFHLPAVSIRIIEETENRLTLRISDDSELEWRYSSAYPENMSALHLGLSNSLEISRSLSIPIWTNTLALPNLRTPLLQTTNPVTEIIHLDRELGDDDIQAIRRLPTVEIKDIGFSRYSPTAVLTVYPVKVVNSKQVEIIRSLDISIQYGPESNSRPRISQSKISKAVKRSVINKKYLREWQRAPNRKLRKRTDLPSGKWFRITVDKDGIYTIDHADLVEAGMTDQSVPVNTLFLFSNATGGREIDDTPGIDVNDNLLENARLIEGGEDNSFDDGDYLLFYGRSTSGVDTDEYGKLEFHRNAYSNVNYYWLLLTDTEGSPKSMGRTSPSSAAADMTVNTFEKIDRHELELTNFLRSGKAWYGEKFSSSGTSISVIFQIPEIVSGTTIPVELDLKARGADNETAHYFKLYLNGSTTPFASWSAYNWYVSSKSYNLSMLTGNVNIIKMDYTASKASAQAHLDYMQIRYDAPLAAQTDELDFWGPDYTGNIQYSLTDIDLNDPLIYDVTDWTDVSILEIGSPSGSDLDFTAFNDKSKRSHYLLTSPEKYKDPDRIALIENPEWNTIRRPDISGQYLIITDEKFIDAAENIAQLHSQDVRSSNRLSTHIVYQDQILREFNADIVDPHAIRQCLTYAFNNWTVPPEFVLLLGDGTFDYRHIESESGDYVMTYQVEKTSGSGNAGFSSFSTDMRYTYVNGDDKRMDMAIGRINSRSSAEALAAVEKIRSYTLEPIYGDWRSKITLVADDPERPLTNERYHINDTEDDIAGYLPKTINIKKLYLLEYPEVQDASSYGVKKPDATEDLLKQIEDGTVLINYFGHGSPTVWAQEYILEMNRDLGQINTGMKLPFWIAGTCSWGQFDDISGSCFPEALVIEPNDGGIAALAASRATYGIYNAQFVNNWIVNLFNESTANHIRIGEILESISCSGSGINENNEKYILFGDPALYLALPTEPLNISELDSDTLKTLSNIRINGTVTNTELNFSGNGLVKLYDSQREVTRYWVDKYDETKSMSYGLPGEILFNGSTDFLNGQVSSQFFIPKDLNYAGLGGKITVIGWNAENGQEVGGFYDPVYFAGSESVVDTSGPVIEIGFTGMSFKSGDIVTPESEFNIKIEDPLGVNIAGRMGHEISLVFDEDENMSYVVTEYFTYDTNSDSSGSLLFQMPSLEPGTHSVRVTAWDNSNNSSEVSGIFTLQSSAEFSLERVVNYPNPFSSSTDITFQLTGSAIIECSIYTVRGLRIRTLEPGQLFMPGFNTLYWNGEDDFGDTVAKGIYIYRIKARSAESQEKDTYIGKMVKAG